MVHMADSKSYLDFISLRISLSYDALTADSALNGALDTQIVSLAGAKVRTLWRTDHEIAVFVDSWLLSPFCKARFD